MDFFAEFIFGIGSYQENPRIIFLWLVPIWKILAKVSFTIGF